MRLDKYLADGAIGTRSQVKKIIKDGRVNVNGVKVKDSGLNINPESDTITFDGNIVSYSKFEYYMLNKPAGLISQSRKNSLKRGEKSEASATCISGYSGKADSGCKASEITGKRSGASDSSYITDVQSYDASVVDLITESGKIDLFPCGRLDKDTEGLLLITNDGKLAHELLSPKHHVDKTYYAELTGILSDSDVTRLQNGIDIGDDKPTLPCKIEYPIGLGRRAEWTRKKICEKEKLQEHSIYINDDYYNDSFDDSSGEYFSNSSYESFDDSSGEYFSNSSYESFGVSSDESSSLFEDNTSLCNPESASAVCITIHEGRYHQVKRMFEAVGLKVTYLKRISFGPLTLDPGLEPGDYRALTEAELSSLKNR